MANAHLENMCEKKERWIDDITDWYSCQLESVTLADDRDRWHEMVNGTTGLNGPRVQKKKK